MEQVKITVAIPAELHRRLQHLATKRDEQVGALVRQMIEEYLAQAPTALATPGERETVPEISCSTIGVLDCAEMEAELDALEAGAGATIEYTTAQELEVG